MAIFPCTADFFLNKLASVLRSYVAKSFIGSKRKHCAYINVYMLHTVAHT